MKSKPFLLLLLLATFCLSSCFPEERIWWSPQGDKAIVSISNRLHLVSKDGELGPPLTEKLFTNESSIRSVSWQSDGNGFLYVRERFSKTWEETRTLISAEEIAIIDQLMPAVSSIIEASIKTAGSLDNVEGILSAIPITTKKRFLIALIRTIQNDPAAIDKLLPFLDAQAKQSFQETVDQGFQLNELCVFNFKTGTSDAVPLTRSLLSSPVLAKVSPKHNVVAWLKVTENEDRASLELAELNGPKRLTIAQNVLFAFDWAPDGETLLFTTPISSEAGELIHIQSISALKPSGEFFKSRQEKQEEKSKASDYLESPVVLAAAFMLNRPVMQALPDGRILFTSLQTTFPALGTGLEKEPGLYVISADRKSVDPIPSKLGGLPTDLNSLVASPDGKYVAIVETKTDTVGVIELSTGKTQIISPPHERWECRTLPAWKSPTELTFAALHGAENQPQWMLWSIKTGELQCLSEKWPEKSTSDWLAKKADPTPEAQPILDTLNQPENK